MTRITLLMQLMAVLAFFCYEIEVQANQFERAEVEQTGNLLLEIDGLKSNEGNVRIGLANSEESYSGKIAFVKQAEAKITDKRAEYIFKNLPFGEYALKIYHDKNENDKLDKAIFGAPIEPYGFSNNARAFFGPPAYNESKFEFRESKMNLTVTVD